MQDFSHSADAFRSKSDRKCCERTEQCIALRGGSCCERQVSLYASHLVVAVNQARGSPWVCRTASTSARNESEGSDCLYNRRQPTLLILVPTHGTLHLTTRFLRVRGVDAIPSPPEVLLDTLWQYLQGLSRIPTTPPSADLLPSRHLSPSDSCRCGKRGPFHTPALPLTNTPVR